MLARLLYSNSFSFISKPLSCFNGVFSHHFLNTLFKGTYNYENLYVFKSWEKGEDYIDEDKKRFEKLWNDEDFNLKIYSIPNAIRSRIFQLRESKSPPYRKQTLNKWRHQDEAISDFLKHKHGILEMATGTGKTRTAMKIMQQLFQEEKIKKVVITMRGDDLLDQWYKELNDEKSGFSNLNIRKHYDLTKEMTSFISSNKRNILLISRNHNYLNLLIPSLIRNDKNAYKETLFVFDEVHGMGSDSLVKNLSGKIRQFTYRLGLSATPVREYDEDGNEFIEQEIGNTIYKFTLKDAIKRGVLCEFDYKSVAFELSVEDRRELRNINAKYAAKEKANEPFREEDKWLEISKVYKLSKQKLPLFKQLLEENKQKKSDLLENCLIFVETIENGYAVQEILIDYCQDYHTYFGKDDAKNLYDFAKGKLQCLISCQKLSEGVDIKAVKNIILFSSDKTKLVTIQRIGRSLRANPEDTNKKARVIDFICSDSRADFERAEWLFDVAATRREEFND